MRRAKTRTAVILALVKPGIEEMVSSVQVSRFIFQMTLFHFYFEGVHRSLSVYVQHVIAMFCNFCQQTDMRFLFELASKEFTNMYAPKEKTKAHGRVLGHR